MRPDRDEDPAGAVTAGHLSVDGTMSGGFRGADGEVIQGPVSGDIVEITISDHVAFGQTSATVASGFMVER